MSSSRTAHVWVKAEHGPQQWPGLVLDWHQVDGVWSAFVIYRNGQPGQTVTEWIEQGRLTPAPSQLYGGTAYG